MMYIYNRHLATNAKRLETLLMCLGEFVPLSEFSFTHQNDNRYNYRTVRHPKQGYIGRYLNRKGGRRFLVVVGVGRI